MADHENNANPCQAAPWFWGKESFAVAVILAIVSIIVALPLGFVSVFDGYYDLLIAVSPHDHFDRKSLLFAVCWTQKDAASALVGGANGSVLFEFGNAAGTDSHVISVPYSGRSNFFGNVTSYNQPQYLVVQYNLINAEGETVRRQFPIPQTQGNRSMTVNLL